MRLLKWTAVLLPVCLVASTVLAGCNTFKGAGRDIQKGGQAVENAADNAENKNHNREVQRHNIQASAGHGGSISPSGSTNVYYGWNRTFSIQPSSGYHVENVVVDGRSVGVTHKHTFNNVTGNHTITASFASDSHR